MHTFILQDYATIRGSNNTITQNESGWLDLTPYQDLVFWVDTRELTGTTVTLRLQTSPTKDDLMFADIISSFTLSVGVVQKAALLSAASVPIARYLRWVMTGTATPYDATIRIYVAANSPGM
jgi:hypothetical protein